MITRLVSLALKVFGFKKALKVFWKYFAYPRLKKYVQANDIKEWDEKVLELVNKYIYYLIDSL